METGQGKPTRKEQQQAKSFLSKIKKDDKTAPDKEKNILEWTPSELSTYVSAQTNGMSVSKKFRFAKDLLKKIKEEKAKNVPKD